MRNGNEGKSSGSSPPLDCEVWLGLKMKTDSYSCDGRVGGGSLFSSTSNQVACVNDIYGVAEDVAVQRSFHNPGCRAFGGMPVPGKALFTVSQRQELERQKIIHKYIQASIPVPPQLLFPISSSPALTSPSQSNTSSLDLRFASSSGSDPEPWRCKRTDGKKWRCSRDVAPHQKYCERHAHKSRVPRSRKHVEVSLPHNSFPHTPLLPSNNPTATTTALQPLQSQRSTSQVTSPTSYDQTRCIEWFMRGGSSSSSSDTNPVSSFKQQQWEQVIQISSSRLELNRNNTDHNKNVPAYQPHFEDKQGFISLNPYIPDSQRLENHNQLSNEQCGNSILGSKLRSVLDGLSPNADRLTQTTRHFIDAWEKEGFGGMSSKGLSASSSKKFSPTSSLSLSMSGWNGIGEDSNENGDLGTGMINSDRVDGDGILKPQWMTPVSWMNSPPGGPLGEALCLGNAATMGTNLTSPHGYSNSNTNANTNTNSSSCSKSSCEDGSHALNFIG